MIYLDHNASTPVLPEVLATAMPFFAELYANPSSTTHPAGKMAADAVEASRKKVADYLGCDPAEIIFTSGSTEAINLGIRGAFSQYGTLRNHILVSPTEHSAVLATVHHLETMGAEVSYIPVDRFGRIIPSEMEKLIRKTTLMAVVMGANNETGNINPVVEAGLILHERKVLFFSDVTQIPLKSALRLSEIQASMMCLSGHKMYGMKGSGVLYIRRKDPRVQLSPVVFGGGQENGLRPGTLNTPAIVSLGEACSLTTDSDVNKLTALRMPLLKVLQSNERVSLFTIPEESISNTLYFSVKGFTASEFISCLPELCLSTGSACTSGNKKISHVLTAMDINEEECVGAVRVSFGLTNSYEDSEKVAGMIGELLNKR